MDFNSHINNNNKNNNNNNKFDEDWGFFVDLEDRNNDIKINNKKLLYIYHDNDENYIHDYSDIDDFFGTPYISIYKNNQVDTVNRFIPHKCFICCCLYFLMFL